MSACKQETDFQLIEVALKTVIVICRAVACAALWSIPLWLSGTSIHMSTSSAFCVLCLAHQLLGSGVLSHCVSKPLA